MANPSKRKGTEWESAVVDYLREHGQPYADYLREHGQPYAERRALCGTSDKGDVAGVVGVMIECKNEAKVTLGAYSDEVKAQTANAGASIGVAIIKRRNRGPSDAYVVMTLEQFAAILADDKPTYGRNHP